MSSFPLILLLVPFVSAGFGFDVANWLREPQKICVKGQLRCNGKSQPDVLIELWEQDGVGTNVFDSDGLLSTTTTNKTGDFELCGSESETLEIEPYVIIHHYCGSGEGCVKLFKSKAPSSSIGGSYDMKTVYLDQQILNTEEKCG